MEREFLPPGKPLAEAAADWLAAKARTTPEGAFSLAHVMVAVPTAQSGRMLSLALARRFAGRGLLAPRICLQNDLPDAAAGAAAAGGRPCGAATEADELHAIAGALLCGPERPALFPAGPGGDGAEQRDARRATDAARTLAEVFEILSAGALTAADVVEAAVAPDAPDGLAADLPRWREIAAVEKAAAEALSRRGLAPRAFLRKKAAETGCVDPDVEQIVLPALVNISLAARKFLAATKDRETTVLVHASPDEAELFDEWGRPRRESIAPTRPQDIESLPGAAEEAAAIARWFRSIPSTDALPALVACDSSAYPELEGAFRDVFPPEELALANPSLEPFKRSALGRLYICARTLSRKGDYASLSAVLRSGDVARWLSEEFGKEPCEIASAAAELDEVQNAFLPKTASGAAAAVKSAAACEEKAALEPEASGRHSPRCARLRLLAEMLDATCAAAKDPWRFLRRVFAGLELDGRNPAHRELAAAADAARRTREDCMRLPGAESGDALADAVFAAMFDKTAYVLEPEGKNLIQASGWMELQWTSEDEIVIAGMNEGCVPETVLGHAFVPDSLRKHLGLETNADRAARDSFILAEAAACRAPGAVKVFMHKTAADGTVLKPSRLLFAGVPAAELPRMALRLYAGAGETGRMPGRDFPPAWRLKPQFPPPPPRWRKTISPTRLDSYRECPFNFMLEETFGEHSGDKAQELDSLHFGRLCHAALESFAKSEVGRSADENEIRDFLRAEVDRLLPACDAEGPHAILRLQGQAAKTRLDGFARIQAAWRRDGWIVEHSEERFEARIRDRNGTRLRGIVDRIDRNEKTGELAIIDYKTWKTVKKGSLQLALYRTMLQASRKHPYGESAARNARAFWCLLSDDPSETKFAEDADSTPGMQTAREEEAAALLESLAYGIYWPPSRASRWRDKFGQMVWRTPEEGLDPAWIEDQQRRREAFDAMLAAREGGLRG